jgi:hypothetical protein
MIGYDPAAQAIRAARGLPYATGADEPPDWHNHPGMTGPDDCALALEAETDEEMAS